MTNDQKADRLVQALLKSHRWRIRADGRTHHARSAIHAADILKPHVGKCLWYRVYQPMGDFVALVY